MAGVAGLRHTIGMHAATIGAAQRVRLLVLRDAIADAKFVEGRNVDNTRGGVAGRNSEEIARSAFVEFPRRGRARSLRWPATVSSGASRQARNVRVLQPPRKRRSTRPGWDSRGAPDYRHWLSSLGVSRTALADRLLESTREILRRHHDDARVPYPFFQRRRL